MTQMRLQYADEGVSRADLPSNPLQLFEQWFTQYLTFEQFEPNAMVVATASKSGAPSQRTVLMKAYDEEGFIFYTNYGSRKAEQIQENAQASLIFPWILLHRQVIIEGSISKISKAESLEYFQSRPRGSQLGAWASAQSEVIPTRKALESNYQQVEHKFSDTKIDLPTFWGGYRVVPARYEFWQGRTHRLHDRFLYSHPSKGEWKIDRLSP